ncbi:MAG: tail fiber domain-containing protein [Bacteroidetes bacterium]|nr:tail fiber domain-containing protein [Bacteroidota bacterium]
MKSKILIALTSLLMLLLQQSLTAQWINSGTSSNYFSQPDNTGGVPANYIRSIGIGYFGSNQPLSYLHIDANTLTKPSNWASGSEGEVFRTDAPNASGNHEYWRMYHGGSEKFNIVNYSGSNDIYLGTLLSGSLNFNTYSALRMTIDPNGLVGIGTATPSVNLDVQDATNGGRINIGGAAPSSYMIDDYSVLWYNGITDNIFVGYTAGSASVTGHNNTFVGTGAGNANTSAANNTFVGKDAGVATVVGGTNTFIGNEAGFSNVNGYYNVFVGDRAGYNTDITAGSIADFANTFIGTSSGLQNIDGYRNTFVGLESGTNNRDGFENVLVGDHSGWQIYHGSSNVCVGFRTGEALSGGTSNTFIGDHANTTSGHSSLLNSTAIGANALVTQDHSMVLGSINGVNGATGDTKVGIGVTAPAKRLEINDGTTGFSGLRFTSLTSATGPTGANPGTGVLAVGPSGDVIYVPAAATGATGATGVTGAQGIQGVTGAVGATGAGNVTGCTGATNFVNKWTGTTPPTICNSIIFDNGTNAGIGTTVPAAKLDVENAAFSFGNTGVYGAARNAGLINLGVVGHATFPPAFASVAQVNGLTALPFNSGVVGIGEGAAFNFGGIFEANGCSPTANNYGVYASAVQCTTGISQAGYFQGNVFATGTITPPSDIKLKDSIQNLTGALSIISRLHPKNYVFKTDTFPYMNLSQGAQHGLIAQQVDTVLPELVHEVMQPQIRDTSGAILQDTMTFKTLDYTSLIPITIRAIQELDSLQGTKLTSCTGTAPPAANNLTKWDSASNVLCTSLIYDDGNRIGIPVVDAHSFVNVVNSSDTITAGSFHGGYQGVYGLGDAAIDKPVGVTGESRNATDVNRGVVGLAVSYSPYNNAGVFGTADSADNINAGVVGLANGLYSGAHKAGVLGFASGSTNENFGGRFEASDTFGLNYGLYASTGGSGRGNYAGYFDGDVIATGTVTWTSDQNLKTNVRDINSNDALATVLKLAPKTYNYRTADYPYMNLASGNQYGLLAQDVQQVLPELVSDITQPERRDLHGNIQSPKLEYKGLNYVGIIPVLIGALKQQQTKIDSLNKVIDTRLNGLEDRLNQCCRPQGSRKTDEGEGNTITPPANENGAQVNHMSIELSSMQVIVLEQNVPNPFAEQTSISYFVPENMNNAQIIFTDMLGTVIKTADIKTGYGVMTVFASNLSTGQYSYTLLVNGKTIETKKMVKSK